MDGGVFNVLAPDIQKSLDVSDAVLGAIGGATGVLFVLGAIPMSSLVGPLRRGKRLVAITMSFWAVIIALTGAVQNAFQMFLARLGAGLGQSAQLPVSAPLLVDTYPITARARIFAMLGGAQAVGTMAAPFLAGGIAALAGGDNGWRWAFLLLGVVALPIALSRQRDQGTAAGPATRCSRCSARSSHRKSTSCRSRLSVAFERLRKIQSFYYFLVGMAALGFALFTAPLFLNLYFDEELGLDAFERGLVATVIAIPTLHRDRRSSGRRADDAVPPQPARRDGVRRPARRAVRHRARRRDLACRTSGRSSPCSRSATRLRPSRVHDPPRGRLDDHPLPAARPRHRDDRHLRVPVRLVLRRGAHRPAERRLSARAPRSTIIVLPSDAHRRRAHRARRAPRPPRHDDGRRGARRGAGRARPHAAARRRSSR